MLDNNNRIGSHNFKTLPEKRKGYLQLSLLVIFAFITVFFPRLLVLINAPSFINVLHMGLVPILCVIVLCKTKVKDRKQIAISKELLIALIIFLGVNLASALLNHAGTINAFVNFLLLCEHFLFLLMIISLPMTPEKLKQFRDYLVLASAFHIGFAYVQRYIFQWHLLPGLQDNIKGVFIFQGSGHVVGASVALTFGVYYAIAAKNRPLWLRAAVFLATFWHTNMADAKQVILVFGLAGIFLLLTKFDNIAEAIKFLIVLVLIIYLFFWLINNVPGFGAFRTWMRPEIYGPDGAATLLKTAPFRIVPTYYTSPLHPWLGLGPGHTVGRLGGWMLNDYRDLLRPLGSTIHPASRDVWQAIRESWLGSQSSMFSPLFGWAGVWGDLGWVGIGSFIYVWSVVWRRICFDDVCRFFVLTIFVFGLVFSQMEEPGYMIYVVSIIGLRWQEYQLTARRSSQINRQENSSEFHFE
jgi:hypothetical protein